MAHPTSTVEDDHSERPNLVVVQDQQAEDTAPVTAPGGDLQPLLAGWLRDRQQFLDRAAGGLHRAAHRTSWHGLRLPFYMARLALFAPRGLGRLVRLLWNALTDGDGRELRMAERDKRNYEGYLKLKKDQRDTIRPRQKAAMWLAGLALGAVVAAWFLLPGWVLCVLVAVAVQALGWVGRPLGKQFVQPAILPEGVPEPLRAELAIAALCSLGIAKMGKPEDDLIRQVTDVATTGKGDHVAFELPPGVTAAKVMENREPLAGALRRDIGCVWPSGRMNKHPSWLDLYVSYEPMATGRQAKWPLLNDGSVNVFNPTPLFTNQQGAWVTLVLAYTRGVVGGVPGSGKTFGLRQIAVATALDPRTKLFVFDGKGDGDMRPLAQVAHAFHEDDEEDGLNEALASLKWIQRERSRRSKILRELPHDICPENKVTSELADRRDLGLEPIVVIMDETQVYFDGENQQLNKEFKRVCSDLVKRGRSTGIICYFATQRPDKDSIPTGISGNVSIRLCFKVENDTANDMVLGTSAHKNGLKANLLTWADKGIAYLKGDGQEAVLVRTVWGLDQPQADRICLRARLARERQGRLTGYAAGEIAQTEAEQVGFLDDVRRVVGAEPTIHLMDLAPALGRLKPMLYGALDTDSLGKMLRKAGVETRSVHVSGKPRAEASNKGIRYRDLVDASATEVLGDADDVESADRDDRVLSIQSARVSQQHQRV